MLNRNEVELIQREIDGANTPGDSAAVRALLAADPEAQALAAELREVAQLFERVGERAPPPRLKRAILAAVQTPQAQRPHTIGRWLAVLLESTTQRLEEMIMTKKAILIGATAVAIVIVGAYVIAGFPPLGGAAGTIGGGSISGVQQASRYHGRVMTQADVTLDNPQIAALFQNHEILALVKSDAFHSLMANEAFRELQRNDAFHSILATEAFRIVMQSDAYREVMNNDAYRELMKNEVYQQALATAAFRDAQSTQAWREVQASDAYRALEANASFHALQANAAFRELEANESFRALQANETFRTMQSDAAFQSLMANDAFRVVMANEAMRVLQASETFRSVAQNAQLSEAFMTEANRIEQ